jgi:hypothetical protein
MIGDPLAPVRLTVYSSLYFTGFELDSAETGIFFCDGEVSMDTDELSFVFRHRHAISLGTLAGYPADVGAKINPLVAMLWDIGLRPALSPRTQR